MAGSAANVGAKGGAGKASPAALFDDQETRKRRRSLFDDWKDKRQRKKFMDYSRSPEPPVKRT